MSVGGVSDGDCEEAGRQAGKRSGRAKAGQRRGCVCTLPVPCRRGRLGPGVICPRACWVCSDYELRGGNCSTQTPLRNWSAAMIPLQVQCTARQPRGVRPGSGVPRSLQADLPKHCSPSGPTRRTHEATSLSTTSLSPRIHISCDLCSVTPALISCALQIHQSAANLAFFVYARQKNAARSPARAAPRNRGS